MENLHITAADNLGDPVLLAHIVQLYQAIFQDDPTPRLTQIKNYKNLIVLVAYANGQPAAFKIGYSLPGDDTTLYSWAGGTLPAFRGHGLASKLMEAQHKKAAALGIHTVETKCRPKWPHMMALNQRFGFALVKEYQGHDGGTKFLLRKVLAPCLALFCMLLFAPHAHAAPALHTRCGWYENPTPNNATLRDKDGTWDISIQGGGLDGWYGAKGADNIPDFPAKAWVHTNGGDYGYGCACLKVADDPAKMRILRITRITIKPLKACRQDKALKGEPWHPLP